MKEHEFLCDNEEQLCSPTRPVAYLQHMQFDQEVVISDKTSVPFRGKVTIEEPQDIDMDLNDGIISGWPQFLPLAGATVCLGLRSEKLGSNSVGSNCVTTNRQGEYILVGLVMHNAFVAQQAHQMLKFLVFYCNSLQLWA